MIELNKKTQQDFLNREWVQRLLEVGVDMSDAKYCIIKPPYYNSDYVVRITDTIKLVNEEYNAVPTYTLSEILYKLHEWIWPTIDGIEYRGGLRFLKDAPFYIFYYDLETEDYQSESKIRITREKEDPVEVTLPSHGRKIQEYIHASFEYPIESAASLLVQCHAKDIGIKNCKTGKQVSDVGDISDK
jgi:hypothetical protein